ITSHDAGPLHMCRAPGEGPRSATRLGSYGETVRHLPGPGRAACAAPVADRAAVAPGLLAVVVTKMPLSGKPERLSDDQDRDHGSEGRDRRSHACESCHSVPWGCPEPAIQFPPCLRDEREP